MLIPSGPAGTILHEQAEYRTATLFPRTPNRPRGTTMAGKLGPEAASGPGKEAADGRLISPFQDGDLSKMEASI